MKMLKLLICTFTLTLLPQVAYPAIVINEFLADPPLGLVGDANRDGTRSSSQDEFVELLNTGGVSEDLSSWSLWDGTNLRHQFSNGTLLSPSARFVIFGGGAPQFPTSVFAIASSGELSLNNAGDQIILKDKFGNALSQISYGNEANQDQSLTRFPEGGGVFQLHNSVSTQKLLFSPGTDVEGKVDTLPTASEPATLFLMTFGIFGMWRWKLTQER